MKLNCENEWNVLFNSKSLIKCFGTPYTYGCYGCENSNEMSLRTKKTPFAEDISSLQIPFIV